MANSVYFASTTLHLYTAAAIAAGRPGEDAHLIFIDQPEGKPYALYDIVRNWPGSPFSSVNLYYGRFPGLLNKLKRRRQLFSTLKSKLAELLPEHIFVGNDRRIEFQFAMHAATTLGCNPVGHYMDEGVFTYVGRKASRSFKDMIIDNFIKKISYGMWWKNPPTIGGSDWISYIHPAFPDLVHPLLRGKHITPLDASRFNSPAMLELSETMMLNNGVEPAALAEIDTFVTLPHESLFERDPDYKKRILAIIRQQSTQGKRVAVKYHPRNKQPDPLSLTAEGVCLLPSQVSFEALLPYLSDQCEVWGDLSSTMVMARWLRPTLKVTAFTSEKPDFYKLFENIGITTMETISHPDQR